MHCPKCHRELTNDEPVYRWHSWEGWSNIRYRVRAWYTAVLYVCESCEQQFRSALSSFEHYEEYKCAVCQRTVYYRIWQSRRPGTRLQKRPTYMIACSPECRKQAHNRRAYARRRGIEYQLQPRPCPICGDPFTPKRSDAKVCSTRCRMRQYRSERNSIALPSHAEMTS
jgi:rubrerythrin